MGIVAAERFTRSAGEFQPSLLHRIAAIRLAYQPNYPHRIAVDRPPNPVPELVVLRGCHEASLYRHIKTGKFQAQNIFANAGDLATDRAAHPAAVQVAGSY